MTTTTLTRQDAFALLTTCNKSESLIKHAISVQGIMRHFAAKPGEDPEMWGIIGLVHDLGYEPYPEKHCHKTLEILGETGGTPTCGSVVIPCPAGIPFGSYVYAGGTTENNARYHFLKFTVPFDDDARSEFDFRFPDDGSLKVKLGLDLDPC